MQQKTLLAFTVFVIVFFSFYKFGQHPISPWDEARHAINALEIIRTSDPVNLYFHGQPENWNFKPPFAMWCQVLSFKLFGVHELALRMPSALAIIGIFFIVFKIIICFRSPRFAAWTCLMLASVKGLIGWHVGRTGDTDAMLTLFLVAFVYCALLVIDKGKRKAALDAGLFLGLAFLVKGPASWVLLPGLLLYIFLTKRFKNLIKDRVVWAGLFLAGAFPVGWFAIQRIFGNKPVEASMPVENAFEGLFKVDLWERFAQTSDGSKALFDPGFFFYSLDKTFNLWHLIFFGFLVYGLYHLVKTRSITLDYLIKNERNRMLLLSLCLYFPLAVFLALAAKSFSWYLAPTLPFVGIATFWGIRHFWFKYEFVKWAFWGLLAFTLTRQFVLFWNVKPKPAIVFDHAKAFEQADTIYQIGTHIEQDVLCYLYFFGNKMKFDAAPFPLPLGSILFFHKVDKPDTICTTMKLVVENESYKIFKPD